MAGRHCSTLFATLLLLPGGAVAETCRYSGTGDHSIRIAVAASVSREADGLTTDVLVELTTSTLFYDIRYLAEERATYRAGEVWSIAANSRTIVNGRARRQQWDVFTRTPEGLVAQRVQAKSLDGFRIRHPGFVAHWDAATFGRPWLADYAAAPPDRRPDLDLAAADAPAGLRPPLALAFYWSRWLGAEGQTVPVFLPGFKRDARMALGFGAASASPGDRSWTVTLSHPGLSASRRSTATAFVSSDHALSTLALDLHGPAGSARATLRREGCLGEPVPPP